MPKIFRRFIFIAFLLGNVFSLQAQQFLNGSFEENNANDCAININNVTFNNLMDHVKGIGDMQLLDILFDQSCGNFFGNAQEGHYFVSLENYIDTTPTTAISLELSEAVQINNDFSFSFYNKKESFPTSPIEIGISNDSVSFGSLVYTVSSIDTIWKKQIVTFIAPLTGKYITARAAYNLMETWMLIDNFSNDTTSATVSIDEPNSKTENFKLYPNPNNGLFFIDCFLPYGMNGALIVCDPLGQELLVRKVTEDQPHQSVDLSGLTNGYFCKFFVNDELYKTEKLIIEK